MQAASAQFCIYETLQVSVRPGVTFVVTSARRIKPLVLGVCSPHSQARLDNEPHYKKWLSALSEPLNAWPSSGRGSPSHAFCIASVNSKKATAASVMIDLTIMTCLDVGGMA